MKTWVVTVVLLGLGTSALGVLDYELNELEGTYVGLRDSKLENVAGMAWGDLQYAKIHLSVTQTAGEFLAYHDAYNSYELLPDLYVSIWLPEDADSGHSDWWHVVIPGAMGDCSVSASFQLMIGYPDPYSVPLDYSGDFVVTIWAGRTMHGGDIITIEPVTEITDAWLVIPEPGTVVLLGLGALVVRRAR